MLTFERDGISFSYLDEGDPSGVPFVFQHGLGGDVSQPSDVFSPPPGFRLLSLDCRGHGETRPLGNESKLSFSVFADDAVALLDLLGIGCTVVGGISMGAGVALNLALRRPQRVAGLVLSRPAWLDSPMPTNLKAYPVIARLLKGGEVRWGRELFEETEEYSELERAVPGAGTSLASSQFCRAHAQEFAAVLERLANDAPNRDRAEWRRVRVPTLVLATRRDPTHPYNYAEILAHNIPSAELTELTPKTVSEEHHASDTQKAIEGFLARHFSTAALKKAAKR
jgi:pimeloyl-ACP methyl ester carboxylesterase